MQHYYSFLLLKGLLKEFQSYQKEQRRLSHNKAMAKYRNK